MKQTNAKLILASKNAKTGDILFTWVLTFPRIILAEVNTHRMLSRNTASSRAIPSKKLRGRVLEDPFVPVSIGANQKGMQAGAEITGWRRNAIIAVWKAARYPATFASWLIDKLGGHKQVANRLTEPWMWVEQIVSATDINNVLLLRNHEKAEPHFQILAKQMQEQVELVKEVFDRLANAGSGAAISPKLTLRAKALFGDRLNETLQLLQPGQWHLPFTDKRERLDATGTMGLEKGTAFLKKVSAARCARVSYYLPENGQKSTPGRDAELCDRLAGSVPRHLSPFEHQAVAAFEHVDVPLKIEQEDGSFLTINRAEGNFKGFVQYRKFFEGESGEWITKAQSVTSAVAQS